MFCGKCGQENEKDARFCRECGSSLTSLEFRSYGEGSGGDGNYAKYIIGIIACIVAVRHIYLIFKSADVSWVHPYDQSIFLLLNIAQLVAMIMCVVYAFANHKREHNLLLGGSIAFLTLANALWFLMSIRTNARFREWGITNPEGTIPFEIVLAFRLLTVIMLLLILLFYFGVIKYNFNIKVLLLLATLEPVVAFVRLYQVIIQPNIGNIGEHLGEIIRTQVFIDAFRVLAILPFLLLAYFSPMVFKRYKYD